MQQIGFALPAVFGIITSLVFNLSADDVPDINIILFFWSIALFVVPGIITWVSICIYMNVLVFLSSVISLIL